MNYKLFITIVVFMFASNLVKGQNQSYQSYQSSKNFIAIRCDSLIVERQDGQKISLIWPYNSNIKKNVEWRQLLDDFQSDFAKVVEDIPDYKFCSITYKQKKSLVVDEVRGKETYVVNEKDGMEYVSSNTCKIRGNKIELIIEFSEYNELLDLSLKTKIEAAIALLKNKFYISDITPERHYYSLNSASFIPTPMPKLNLIIPLDVRLGLLKNQPYLEFRSGLGFSTNRQNYIALTWSAMTHYDQFIDKTIIDKYVGFRHGAIAAGFGYEVALKVKGDMGDFEDLFMKAGIYYKMNNRMQFGVDYYIQKDPTNTYFGFSFGFGI